jgi:hypothetical protein
MTYIMHFYYVALLYHAYTHTSTREKTNCSTHIHTRILAVHKRIYMHDDTNNQNILLVLSHIYIYHEDVKNKTHTIAHTLMYIHMTRFYDTASYHELIFKSGKQTKKIS